MNDALELRLTRSKTMSSRVRERVRERVVVWKARGQ